MMIDVDAIAGRLRQAVGSESSRLDRIALEIAHLDDEPGDDDAVIAKLDRLGERVRVAARGSIYVGVEALEGILAGEEGLRGDEEDYDDPRNSFLPRVLERRRGLPILLSLVYLEVARRAAVPLFGLALPGHFVVGYNLSERSLVALDPFAGGRILDRLELAAIVSRTGRAFHSSMLAPATPYVIATRMLRNLMGSYQRRGHADKLRAAARLLLALEDTPATRRALADAEQVSGRLN